MIEYFKEILKSHSITDIYLTGFIDIENGTAQFYHDLRFLYFEISPLYIEFESISQFSRLKIKIKDSVEHNFKIDKDMIKAQSSVSEIILNDTMSNGNNINSIVFYNLEEQEEITCDAIELNLGNGQMIFLDPSYYFGINIGGTRQKQIWEINLNKDKNIHKTCIKISGS